MNRAESRIMNNFLDEHRYAWRLIRAARQLQAESAQSHDQLTALLNAALDTGLDRATLAVELAAIGGRLLALCDPTAVDDNTAVSDEVCLTS
jgi:hypothetical protein